MLFANNALPLSSSGSLVDGLVDGGSQKNVNARASNMVSVFHFSSFHHRSHLF